MKIPALLLCLLPISAHADPVRAHYVAYAAGLNVLTMDSTLDLQPGRYRMDIEFQTAGTVSLFNATRIATRTDGLFSGPRAAPTRMFSAGTLGGAPRKTSIEYQAGQPVIRELSPPNETERETVPADDQRNTIDTLSAMAQLVRQVNQTGKCEGSVRTFDGRRLSELRAWTIGTEALPPSGRSSFAGPALHCEFEGKLLAGYKNDEPRDRQQRPQRGGAWFAAVTPGGPQIPVRISFHTRWFGDAVMYITDRE